MERSHSRILILAALAAVLVLLIINPARADQTTTVDETQQFLDAGAHIDGLQVIVVGGILVIRGRTTDQAKAEEIGRIAQNLGYKRVANLVQIIEPADDAAIQRQAERQLAMNRSLDGCQFRVASQHGVIRLAGHVLFELQKDVAIDLLRNIDGVRQVRSTLDR
jgi:osmotically-inducible protein OsmY